MKTKIQEKKMWQSSELPHIQTTDAELAEAIAWADQEAQVWHLLLSRRSKAFGIGSSAYIGWTQNNESTEALLERLRHFHQLVQEAERINGRSMPIQAWAAKFTFDHFYDRDFASGFFQQHDARYPRNCLTLDYTPNTLEAVLDKFCQWMDRHYRTAKITLDGKTVRVIPRREVCHG